MKIGLYGGSFNPIHHGHLIFARLAKEQLGLDRVVFIPAAISPFKQDITPAPAGLRCAMVCAAIAGELGFECSDIEIHRPGPSYSIDTVRQFRDDEPDAELYYLIGDDILPTLDAWHEIGALRKLVTFVVMARDAITVPPEIPVVQRRFDISSTDIRNRVACGRSIRYLLPMDVSHLIEQNGLYLNE
jgi:nicotinate-nucleotide adenylyltransferase